MSEMPDAALAVLVQQAAELSIRCPHSDLILGQCAMACCRPDLAGVDIGALGLDVTVVPGEGSRLDEPGGRIVRRWTASRRIVCDGCATAIHPGDTAAKTRDGDIVCGECAA